MGQLRRDSIIGRWVIVADDAASLKPADYEKEDRTLRQATICQFCPGRERQTTPEVDAIRDPSSQPNGPGWSMRVVSNKFPALRIEGNLDKRGVGIYDMSNGIGAHEVLIENPDHSRQLSDLTAEEIADVFRLFQNRSLSLANDRRFKYIMIFKNYGESAGASVEHGHGQIIALPMVPKYVLEELEGSFDYHTYRGRCVYCDMIQQEYGDRERMVTENQEFLAFCPFVPRYPFETWIIPKAHRPSFVSMPDQERLSLAAILKETLLRIKGALADPSYNFYLHVSPINYEHPESYHWHIEIIPQLTREAGFEWGTGFYIVRTSPRVAARYLREAKVPAVA